MPPALHDLSRRDLPGSGAEGERMRRDVARVGLLWLGLTVLAELLAQAELNLAPGSDKAELIRGAFTTLLVIAVPVFTFVVAMLLYSVIRFRHAGQPTVAGATIHGRGPIPIIWFAITSGLAILIMVYPGLIELPKVTAIASNPDLRVKVTGVQWTWQIEYPDLGIQGGQELVLPVGRTVTFDITSLDVVHAFWVPAFMMRIDAVPGQTTQVTLTPTRTGSFAADRTFRLQCSQLCGLDHATMMLPVRVLPAAEFDAWIKAQPKAPTAGATPIPGATELSLSARNTLFSTRRLEAPAGKPMTITFDNQDAGIVHNIAIYESATGPLVDQARSPLEAGPITQVLNVPALPAGTYLFRCDAHPTPMVGVLEVR